VSTTHGNQDPTPPDPLKTTSVRVVRMRTACWKCRRATTAVIGLDVPGAPDLILFDFHPLKAMICSLITDELRSIHHVGAIRRRSSRATGGWYVSNGCYWCDVILGDFPLLHEELGEVRMYEGDQALITLLETTLPTRSVDQLQWDYFE
jgi:hypothetical protein